MAPVTWYRALSSLPPSRPPPFPPTTHVFLRSLAQVSCAINASRFNPGPTPGGEVTDVFHSFQFDPPCHHADGSSGGGGGSGIGWWSGGRGGRGGRWRRGGGRGGRRGRR